MNPERIILRRGDRTLLAEWADGTSVELAHRTLRMSCRCAECTSIRRGGSEVAAPEDIEVLELVAVGQNAVRMRFSDGHERGIFPFAYLRELHR